MLWCCMNDDCPERKGMKRLEFSHPLGVCPACRARPPATAGVCTIHWQLPNPDGLIQGKMGLRYSVACNPAATMDRVIGSGDQLTLDSVVVTCKDCQQNPAWQAKIDSEYTATIRNGSCSRFKHVSSDVIAGIERRLESCH